jgi:hypothetical protein
VAEPKHVFNTGFIAVLKFLSEEIAMSEILSLDIVVSL